MNEIAPHRVTDSSFGEIERQFWAMHARSRSEAPSPVDERRRQLQALREVISSSSPAFIEAIARDYSFRAAGETMMTEIVPALMMVGNALSNVGNWMRPEVRGRSIQFWPARNELHWQPKGVVLIISPWNYPFQLAVGPVAAALAAGNRVIIKPSEFTPATSALLKQKLEAGLGADRVLVVTGGPEVAEALCRLPFDHILFTGSTNVGKKVMAAAAQNLTPVTLELGGKSPAILHPDYDMRRAVHRLVRGKLLNAGQTCIAPDYALVQRGQVDTFVRLFREKTADFYPRILNNIDYTPIISSRHYERIGKLIEDARANGAVIETVDPAGELGGGIGSAQLRKIAPTVITGGNDAMAVMREEIFGPVLPVLTYETLDEAIAYVNARPRPLALYYFGSGRSEIRRVLNNTVSGGVTVNDTIYHFAQEELPFGGIGPSGMGTYHGRDGFRTFSHGKGVLIQRRLALTSLLAPPYDKWFRKVMDFVVWRNGG
jgi:coniferyl-aldehyde dehydrogenase